MNVTRERCAPDVGEIINVLSGKSTLVSLPVGTSIIACGILAVLGIGKVLSINGLPDLFRYLHLNS